MWLLNTASAELQYFNSPEEVPYGYAILSHAWDKTEMSYQDLRAIHAQHKRDSTSQPDPPPDFRDLLSPKIRDFLKLAAAHGHAWGWADTCCIDKSSSAELSEAINSMFHYYALADVCFVYLRDVSAGPGNGTAFRASVWHTRGWTLQELLAPRVVVFVDAAWAPLGTKTGLAHLLAEVTRVPAEVLRFEQDIAEVCVGRRMSWAAGRRTTRVEDEAYALLGIFGVSMPTVYGEGRRAFYRLQEEIMKATGDASLFAWGPREERWGSLAFGGMLGSGLKDGRQEHPGKYLFAPSPAAFESCTTTAYNGPIKAIVNLATEPGAAPSEALDVPTFTPSPYGVFARLPVIQIDASSGSPQFFAFLSCSGQSLADSDKKMALGFYLSPRQSTAFLARTQYLIGGDESSLRIILFDEQGSPTPEKPHWTSIYLVTRPDFRSDTTSPNLLALSRLFPDTPPPPFRFPSATLRAVQANRLLVKVSDIPQPYTSSSAPVTFVFALTSHSLGEYGFHAYVTLGYCAAGGAHWTHVRLHNDREVGLWGMIKSFWEEDKGATEDAVDYDWTKGAVPTAERTSHSCAEDHVHAWPRVEDAPPGWYTNRREVPMPDTWLALEGSEGLSRQLAVAISFAACPFAERETMLLKDFKLTCS